MVTPVYNWWEGDGIFSGNLYAENATFWDLTVESGQSITLAGAKFENEGTHTSVDTDWGVHVDYEPTAYLGLYAHNGTSFTAANLVLEAGDDNFSSVLNIVKNSPYHPFSANASGIINDGSHGTFVPDETRISWQHYDNFTKDEYGNIIALNGIEEVMFLNETHLYLEEARTFSLAGVNFESYNESVYNITYTGLRIDDDVSISGNVNGEVILSVVNNNYSESASSILSVSDYVFNALNIFKFNSNFETPYLGAIINDLGKLKIMDFNEYNHSLTGLQFGFIDAYEYDENGQIVGFENESLVMEMFNDSIEVYVPIITNQSINLGNVELDMTKYLLGTGILYGGLISKNATNNSLLDVTAGAGVFVNYSDIDDPVVEYFTWDAQTFYPAVGGDRSRWIGFQRNSTGDYNLIAQSDFTQEEKRTVAVIGRCISTDGLDTCNVPGKYVTPAFGDPKSMEDLFWALGSISINGNIFSSNGSNLLLDRSGGYTFRFSASFGTSPTSPNVHYNEPSLGITNYAYHLQGSTITTAEADIDPDYYDLNGVKTAVSTNKWTLQELWFFPVSRTTHVIYGQEIYNNKGDCLSGIATEDKIINEEVLDGAIRRSYLCIRQGATDLSDEDEAYFQRADADSAGGTYYWELNGVLSPSENVPVTLSNNLSVNSTLHVDVDNSRVGIGTYSPSAELDVVGDTELNGDLDVPTGTVTISTGQLRAYGAGGVTTNFVAGSGAGADLTTGSGDTLIGYNAGNDLTTGTSNTLVGYNAGKDLIAHNFNTFIGQAAGSGVSTSNRVTGIGVQTFVGAELVSYSTGIGMYAGYNSTGQSGTYLGYNAGHSETANGKLWISNYYGDLIEGSFINDWVNIYGDLNVSYDFAVNDSDFFVDSSTGYVGIGTNAPESILHIYENTSEYESNGFTVEQAGEDDVLFQWELTNRTKWTAGIAFNQTGIPFVITQGAAVQYMLLHNETFYVGNGLDFNVDDGSLFVNGSNNRTGIGTTTPSEELVVSVTGSSDPSIIRVESILSSNADATQGIHLFKDYFADYGWMIESSGEYNSDATLDFISSEDGVNTTRLTIERNTGYVGIGTESPSHELNVIGKTNITNDLIVDDEDLFVDISTSRVGMGTDSPSYDLDIYNSAGASLRLNATAGQAVHSAGLTYDIEYTDNAGASIMEINAIAGDGTSDSVYRFGINSGSTGRQDILLYEPNSININAKIGTSGESTYFNAYGSNFGIGTQSPGAGLTVANGRIQVTDSTNPTTGDGLEFGSDSTEGVIVSYDRDGSHFKGLRMNTLNYSWQLSGSDAMYLDSTGLGIGISPTEKLDLLGGSFLQRGGTSTDTYSPEAISSLNVGNDPEEVRVFGTYAYILEASASIFRVVDIHDPTNPALVSTVSTTSSDPEEFDMANNFAYVIDHTDGDLIVIDLVDPSDTHVESVTAVGSNPKDIAVRGGHAYIIDGTDDQLVIMDISDPGVPFNTANASSSCTPNSLEVVGSYAYVACWGGTNDLEIYDITDPYTPIQMYSGSLGNDFTAIEVSDNYIYMTDNAGTPRYLYIYDATDVTAPVEVGNVSLGASGRVGQDIEVVDNYAYIVTSTDPDLVVFDVKDPTAPVLIGSTGLVGTSKSIDVEGRYAYVTEAGTHDDFIIFDVSGIEVQSAKIGSLTSGSATFYNDVRAQEDMIVKGGLDVGFGGLDVEGNINTLGHLRIVGRGQEPSIYMKDNTYDNLFRLHVGNAGANFRLDDDDSVSSSFFGWNIDNDQVMKLDNQGDLYIDGTVIPGQDCGITGTAFTAEESGALTNSAYEFSFGNGDEDVQSIQICSGIITGMSWYCTTGGTNTNISISADRTGASSCSCLATGQECTTTCNEAYLNGEGLSGYTVNAGGASGCVVTWWVRYD